MSHRINTQYAVIGRGSDEKKSKLDAKRSEMEAMLKITSESDTVSLTTETSDISVIVKATFTSPALGHTEAALKAMLKNEVDRHL